MDLLNVKDITVTYGRNPRPTIEHFSLDMKEGEIVSVVGESGSGKTTVIRAILGLLPGGGKVDQGDILFQGQSLLNLKKEQWRELRGSQISMIFQDSGAMINPIRRIGDQFVEYIRTSKNVQKRSVEQGCGDAGKNASSVRRHYHEELSVSAFRRHAPEGRYRNVDDISAETPARG